MNKNIGNPEQDGLKWLFLDLNSYFASVEQQENPHLRGRPVAVVPMETESTCAIAASYEAKVYGIKTGTKIYEARKMCPQLICVLARHDIYVDYHHRILEATERCLPVRKIWSIDEFDCLLLGREREPKNAAALAHKIKRSIWEHVGEAISCSIGIGPNTFLAKVGTEIQKPNGLVLLEPQHLPGPLLDLKLTDLPGINVRMEERLRRARITSVEALYSTSPKQARAIWGGVQGERFWYWLHGYDVPGTETNTCMVGHSRVLDPQLRAPEKARAMARRLLVKASARLRRKGFYAQRLSFSARIIDGPRWAGERRFSAACDPFTFLQHLDALWEEMLTSLSPSPAPLYPPSLSPTSSDNEATGTAFLNGGEGGEKATPDLIRGSKGGGCGGNNIQFKKVSVVLHTLRQKDQITDDLFDTSLAVNREHLQRKEALAEALDTLHNKYKSETVTVGLPPKTLAGHVGTKIAFSRVPDKEEFWG